MHETPVICSTLSVLNTTTSPTLWAGIAKIQIDNISYIVPPNKAEMKPLPVQVYTDDHKELGDFVHSGNLRLLDPRSLVEEHITPETMTHSLLLVDRIKEVKNITPNAIKSLASFRDESGNQAMLLLIRPNTFFTVTIVQYGKDQTYKYRSKEGRIELVDPDGDQKRSTITKSPDGSDDGEGGVRSPTLPGGPPRTLFAEQLLPNKDLD